MIKRRSFLSSIGAAELGNAPTVEGVTSSDVDVDFGENKIVDGQFVPSSEAGFGMRIRGV